MVSCIKFSPELRYTQEQLTEHLPEIEGESEPTAVQINAQKTKLPNSEINAGCIMSGADVSFSSFAIEMQEYSPSRIGMHKSPFSPRLRAAKRKSTSCQNRTPTTLMRKHRKKSSISAKRELAP